MAAEHTASPNSVFATEKSTMDPAPLLDEYEEISPRSPPPILSIPERASAGSHTNSRYHTPGSRRPKDTPFRQQKTPAVRPVFTSNAIAICFLVVGIISSLLGGYLWEASLQLQTHRIQYDGKGTPQSQVECKISSSNEGRLCSVTFNIEKRMSGPIYVYYELSNFYQNMAQYVLSYDRDQLMGNYRRTEGQMAGCGPLRNNGAGRSLNPCGLIANSMFNDQITGVDKVLNTQGISFLRDKNKFRQPGIGDLCSKCDKFGFVKASGEGNFSVRNCLNQTCSDSVCDRWLGAARRGCRGYFCSQPDIFNCAAGSYYAYFYPNEDKIQYLYETFPEVVSPLEGVFNEHFIVWMRTAAFSTFPKLYGIVDETLVANSTITFRIKNNFAVSHFEGTKTLVISNTDWFGGWFSQAPPFFGVSFACLGLISTVLGAAFFAKGRIPGCKRIPGDINRLLF
jgi:hypothetical protein